MILCCKSESKLRDFEHLKHGEISGLCAGYSGHSGGDKLEDFKWGNDSCAGDSGGPLVLKENKRLKYENLLKGF